MIPQKTLFEKSPWLPCEAASWKHGSIKYFYQIELGRMLQNDPTTSGDIEVPYLKAQHVQWGSIRIDDLPTMWAAPKEIAILQVRKGDLLVCEGGEVGRSAIVQCILPENCIIQNALHLVRGKCGNDVRFLNYLLQNAADYGWFDVLCNRATIAHFTVEKFGEIYIALPPIDDQQKIANYLDQETTRINALIMAKEQLLELLTEKRHTLITRAVISGLNTKATFRDSGIPWLGRVPTHWETERAKWLFRERDERSVTGEEEMLTVSHLTGVTPRSEKEVNMFEAETTEGYKICHSGDLVINTLWAWMGAMGVSRHHGIVSPAYHVYIPGERMDSGYVDALFGIPIFALEATRFSKGVWSSRLRLYPEGFFEILLPVPPLEEQRAIVAYIQSETSKLDKLSASAERTLTLLKERRSVLIADAVTGKLSIPA